MAAEWQALEFDVVHHISQKWSLRWQQINPTVLVHMTDGVRGEAVTPLMCLEGNHTVTEENRLSERQVLIQLAGRAELHLLGEGVKESDCFFSCIAVLSYSVQSLSPPKLV